MDECMRMQKRVAGSMHHTTPLAAAAAPHARASSVRETEEHYGGAPSGSGRATTSDGRGTEREIDLGIRAATGAALIRLRGMRSIRSKSASHGSIMCRKTNALTRWRPHSVKQGVFNQCLPPPASPRPLSIEIRTRGVSIRSHAYYKNTRIER